MGELLLEQPWVSSEDLLGPDGEELIWDFCAEEPGWLEQLVELYRDGRMTTRNTRKNMEPVHEFTDKERDAFTRAILDDPWFVNKFKADFPKQSPALQLGLKAVLPTEFFERGLI